MEQALMPSNSVETQLSNVFGLSNKGLSQKAEGLGDITLILK